MPFSLDPDPLLQSHLAGCLDRLDAPRRASILYAYLDGCSHNEIAERLRSPLGTVKAWVRRGLQSLRECME
ncbi:sigma factor-like helix-turn-helix DNA-binding protein [Pandoraea sputorum]|uniref:sigma factor-like helix-turn-helix DNA-binding protein n=1 Tax=Pandoraea sputorum TaxID=93222 RepID=UPI00396A6DED